MSYANIFKETNICMSGCAGKESDAVQGSG